MIDFNRPTLEIASGLLGQLLVREIKGKRLSGLIVETEAYIGHDDSACHASKGRTERTAVMFGPPGYSYVYLIYGMYHMLNVVTEREGFPAAVLIRALAPLAGVDLMETNRKLSKPSKKLLTNGPGKLCQALNIDRSLNQWDLLAQQKLWIEPEPETQPRSIASGPRINIDFAQPKDRKAPWRFWIEGNRFVSK